MRSTYLFFTIDLVLVLKNYTNVIELDVFFLIKVSELDFSQIAGNVFVNSRYQKLKSIRHE